MKFVSPTDLNTGTRRQRGVTLIELLLVLTAGAIIVGAVYGLANLVLGGANVSSAEQNLSSLVSATRNLYANQNTYDGIDNEILNRRGVVPGAMTGSDNNEILDVWGNQVTVAEFDTNASDTLSDRAAFEVSYTNIPSDACVDFATQGDWEGVEINGEPFPDGSVSVSEANSECNDDNDNDIIFVAR